MGYSLLPPLFLLLLFLSLTTSTPHRPPILLESETLLPPSPTTFFEVSRPLPQTTPPICSTLVLQHDFAYTYGRPPITAPYTPCHHSPPHSAVLELSAAASGRQFDRIFGIWLAGAELLRSCTAEPRPNGVIWTVQKDISKYSSLLARPQTLSLFLGNIVDKTYTAVFHVNVSIHFYPNQKTHLLPAHLILPISRSSPGNDGLWFPINSAADAQSTDITIPRNAYRAVLEVYLSFHSQDEFFYSNPPNIYLSANNLTNLPGNGPFREVAIQLDDNVVGAIWPFTVIYTGGINPLLWRPITGIGSFDLPSYDIEITPFLGELLDGKKHRFGFRVMNGLGFWFVDANLHLWLDSKSSSTVGGLIKHEAPDFALSLVYRFTGLDGLFKTSASRNISSTGWVKSSYGKITTHSFQSFDYVNSMRFEANGSIQIVNQTIDSKHGVYTKSLGSLLYSEEVFRNFPLYVYTGTADQVNDSYSLVSDVSLGFNMKKFSGERFSSLRNSQNAEGSMRVKGNLVQSGLGSTQQVYRYESTDGCYFRNVSSSNYTILHDELRQSCTDKGSEFFSRRWMPFSIRRESLASDGYKLKNGD